MIIKDSVADASLIDREGIYLKGYNLKVGAKATYRKLHSKFCLRRPPLLQTAAPGQQWLYHFVQTLE